MNQQKLGARPLSAPDGTGATSRPRRGLLRLRNRSEEALTANIPWLEPGERDVLRRLAHRLMSEASAFQIAKAERLAAERGRR